MLKDRTSAELLSQLQSVTSGGLEVINRCGKVFCRVCGWLIACWPLVALAQQGQTRIAFPKSPSNPALASFTLLEWWNGQALHCRICGGGLATLDYDNDGYQDIFFLNGMPLEHASSSSAAEVDSKYRPALYRNQGDFTFVDVTEAAGVGQITYGMGAVVADYDEDGDSDLYLSNFGQNILYRNNGDGTFANVTGAAGLIMPDKVGAGWRLSRYRWDQDLDLYAGSYVQFKLDQHEMRYVGKHTFHPGPADYPPSADTLFRNNSDGTFTDISQPSGISAHASYTMGVIAFDVDDDSDMDIMVANDQRPNTLWINDGQGHFEDQAVIAGGPLIDWAKPTETWVSTWAMSMAMACPISSPRLTKMRCR